MLESNSQNELHKMSVDDAINGYLSYGVLNEQPPAKLENVRRLTREIIVLLAQLRPA